MMNFGLRAAEIDPVVWGTPANFNGFRVLAALLHGSQVVDVSQTAALNRGHHLCSAGRPSRWALAHILVELFSLALTVDTLYSWRQDVWTQIVASHPMHRFLRASPFNELLFLQIPGDRSSNLGTKVVHGAKTSLTATTPQHGHPFDGDIKALLHHCTIRPRNNQTAKNNHDKNYTKQQFHA